MTVEFAHIDRRKRRILRVIQLFILTPIVLFLLMGVDAKNGYTLQEQVFDLPEYWRWISRFGLILIAFLYFFLYMLLKVNSGSVIFRTDKIQVLKYERIETEYLIEHISKFEIEKDLSYKTDSRFRSQKANKLTIIYRGTKVKIEFSAGTSEEFKRLNLLLSEYKMLIRDFKEGYRSHPIAGWLDF